MATVIQNYSFTCLPCCGGPQVCQFCGDSDLPPTFFITIAGCPLINSAEDYTPLNGSFLMIRGSSGSGPPDMSYAGWTYYALTYEAGSYYDPGAGNTFYYCDSYVRIIRINCSDMDGYVLQNTYSRSRNVSLFPITDPCEVYVSEHGGSTFAVDNLSILHEGLCSPHNTGSTTASGLSTLPPPAPQLVLYPLGPSDSCDPLYIASSGPVQLVRDLPPAGSGFSRYGYASDVASVTVTLHP